ncbi:LamG-like jellyroll fold domain-containing protein [Sulfurovum sp. TSL1]|uniref:LamG-like jellyroll fold domain-containing protein n=1 Tax=Sulfurovum sp. TSL1 TaxID=2826994 RepID=UPI001CC71BD0|nr:LamG-like jellyroll fold domain-containing protein [Sulfurovum sp. TSL1]GIT98065.1 hypothetical protein TSL1_08860 [Sulfurovum sp. TSL1]
MRSNKVNLLKKMLGMLLVAPVMLSLSLFAADPVNHWKLDENDTSSEIYVDSIGAADGTCATSHCPTPSVGQINGAQYFDAAELDRIDVNNTTSFEWDQDANITIEFWMKSQMVPMSNRVMIGRANTLGILWYIGINGTDAPGHVRVAVANDKSAPADNVVGNSQTNVTDDVWHHIAFVLTEPEVKVYIDGQFDFNLTRSAVSDLHASSDVHFGSLNDSASLSYTGNLDEITVYTAAIDAGLIQQHYEMGLQPNLAEVTPVPTPTDDNTPDYTFSSDEAGTITYGGSCSSAATEATAGNNTITFDTLADGVYGDCTITVTDEANNSSAPLSVTEFVVDTTVPDVTAPTLAEVTAVTSPTDDNTPDYTFSSDEAGTITYGGSCSSAATEATAGNNTITFDTLADGVYGDCTITVTDEANNSSAPLSVTEFVVDTTVPDVTAPTLAEVTAVTSPTDDNTPDYTFSSDEAGTITYGGSCSSAATEATAGNNTITFDTLADGIYGDCTITVTDEANNSSAPLSVTEFVVDTTVPIISDGGGGGCTYNPDSKHFDMVFLLMIALGLFYPFRRRFIK